jgi:hypothetical protein
MYDGYLGGKCAFCAFHLIMWKVETAMFGTSKERDPQWRRQLVPCDETRAFKYIIHACQLTVLNSVI